MKSIETLSYETFKGQRIFSIELYDDSTNSSTIIELPAGKWDRATIINLLVRSQYSQDHVEAIINNHFLNIAEWLDKKFVGSEESFDDPDYDELQNWRKECKTLADTIIDRINKINA